MTLSTREQYLLELINRARLDPAGEAMRFGIDLNQDVSGNSITTTPKQVLAPNDLLEMAAREHSQWMLDTDTVSHTGSGGSDPGDRMAAAGYAFTGSWAWAENLAWTGTTGTLNLSAAITEAYEDWFLSAGHRVNLLGDEFREVGIAQMAGAFTPTGAYYNASIVTADFATSGSSRFITGVAYDDFNHDNFYNIGEGYGGLDLQISADGSSTTSTTTSTAGGYALAFPTGGVATVTIHPGRQASVVDVWRDAGNIKLDLSGTTLLSNGNIKLISGRIFEVMLLGIENIDATGNIDANVLVGNAGDNELRGGDGDDTLRGRGGADILDGGLGSDSASYYDSPRAVTIDLAASTATGGDATGDQLISIENVDGSNYSDTISGDAEANTLRGHDQSDVLTGRGGADILDGGAGSDWASYRDAPGAIAVDLRTGRGTAGDAAGDQLISIEHVEGSDYSDIISGNGEYNKLFGYAGDDVLQGGKGPDDLHGGDGNDVASYYGAYGLIVVDLATGKGTAGDALEDQLFSIENVDGSNYSDTIAGDSGANTLRGYGGNDFLRGRGGADILDGGAGIDVVSYYDAPGAISVDLTSGTGAYGDAAGDQLIAIENVTGSNFSDSLAGDAAANALRGQGGNDILRGRGGADVLDGGTGIDLVSYYDATGAISVDLTSGTGTYGDAAGDQLVSIENVNGSNFSDSLAGDTAANTLRGYGGNDILRGRGGADVLDGGAGTDLASYYDARGAISVDLAAGTGTYGDAAGDQLISIENVNGSNFSDSIAGDTAANTLHGYGGNDILRGRGGADVLDGGTGTDTATWYDSPAAVIIDLASGRGYGGDAEGDRLISIENVNGSHYSDLIAGNDNANLIQGFGGNDMIRGRGGADILHGGMGADRFIYASISDSTGTMLDRILDFDHSQGDRIDVSLIDARPDLAGDQAFSFIGSTAFTGSGGQIRQVISSGETLVQFDTDGDGSSDMVIRLTGNLSLAASDFIL
ncbi:CAP domain-containing protein [Tistrella mobilis]